MWKEIQGRNRTSGPQSNSTSDLNSSFAQKDYRITRGVISTNRLISITLLLLYVCAEPFSIPSSPF
ncbi:MAG TPA: hypothetical protein VKA91_11785 [Nitrososphaeraceae archaeon]|nr:hypothetical protein [Nitrososphaeraceae archaeon]